jgi:pyrroline-5-carboxylate reductase
VNLQIVIGFSLGQFTIHNSLFTILFSPVNYQLGIIGAGNMAEAIVRGVLGAKLWAPGQMIAADPSDARREMFTDLLKVPTRQDALEFVGECEAILLSVKPQQMAQVLSALGARLRPTTLVISIAAGISTGYIAEQLGASAKWRIIRAMPNTPMLVNQGMVALACGEHASSDDLDRAQTLFKAAATVIEVDESQMDAVTAVSGSGPAYVFYLVEQMIRAGEELGLTAEQSRTLSAQTILGAARMLTSSTDSPQTLRQKVTSPGGTTAAAIANMESHKWAQATIDAIKAAADRSKELGK